MTTNAAAAPRAEGRGRRAFVLAIASATLLRLVLAARLPLWDDEVYYWLWSRHLSWGYPDHPPLIAAVIALGTRLFGESPLAIRIIPLLLASLTSLFVYLAARDMFDPPAGRRSAILQLGIPIFAVGVAFAFPDGPMSLFFAFGLWTGWRALRVGGWWWIATGVAIALGLLSKLPAAFLALGLAGMLADGSWRRALRDRGFSAGLIVGGLLITPMILWYARHDWSILSMPRPAWLENVQSLPLRPLAVAGAQLAYHGPLALPLLGSLVVAARRARDPAWRYILWMSLPTLAFTLVLSVAGPGRPHWSTPTYTLAAIGLSVLWPVWWARRRALLATAVAVSGLITFAVPGYLLISGVAVDGTTAGWDRAAQIVSREAAAKDAFVIVGGYQSASQLAFALDRAHAGLPVTSPVGAFPLWHPPGAYTGRNVLFIDDLNVDAALLLQPFCRDVQPATSTVLPGGRTLRLYTCQDFSGSFAGYPLRGFP